MATGHSALMTSTSPENSLCYKAGQQIPASRAYDGKTTHMPPRMHKSGRINTCHRVNPTQQHQGDAHHQPPTFTKPSMPTARQPSVPMKRALQGKTGPVKI